MTTPAKFASPTHKRAATKDFLKASTTAKKRNSGYDASNADSQVEGYHV
eukprot:CAMPEP_0170490920 /NCGR_PEP_ID=MMETSP0208-20121228/10031_1 /TAXON_ID=197538 /ORGANISM="Strombidium inclinatum, Strain S3" /LENGTH=48 /DNA_ID= /DNA_START= /DNA_END= /DNA_ORIENTATION=